MMTLVKESKAECCGCTACAHSCRNGCIIMKPDEEGFSYPQVDIELCSDCGNCKNVCPVGKYEETETEQYAFIIQHKDEKILMESTSGGAFTAIAQTALDKGGVVYGAAFDDDLRVVHTSARTPDELRKFRKSKYVQSDLGDCFPDIKNKLEKGTYVCFSGTPCQAEGLRSFLGKDYDNLVLVDFVCHAVPSPLLWEKYKEYRRAGSTDISCISFRNKDLFGYTYSQMKVQRSARSDYYGIETDPFLRAFFSDLCDRPGCYTCSFKKRYRMSDITIWDCFDIDKFEKSMDNNKGATRVLTHTKKGVDCIKSLNDMCHIKEIPPDASVAGVREMIESVSMNPQRDAFFRDIHVLPVSDLFEKYFPNNIKVRTERFIREMSARTGAYRTVKHLRKTLMRK